MISDVCLPITPNRRKDARSGGQLIENGHAVRVCRVAKQSVRRRSPDGTLQVDVPLAQDVEVGSVRSYVAGHDASADHEPPIDASL